MQNTQNITEFALNKRIGEFIKSRRIITGKSQSVLGNAIGVSFQQIQKYESGKNAPSHYKLDKILAELNETHDSFYKSVYGNEAIIDFNKPRKSLQLTSLFNDLPSEILDALYPFVKVLKERTVAL